MTEHVFKEGMKVAVFRSGSFYGPTFSASTVGKVRKDGRFFLLNHDGSLAHQMWSPLKHKPSEAKQAGESGYRRWVTPWTAEHDAQLRAAQERRARSELKEQCVKALEALDSRDPASEAKLRLIKAALEF